MQVLRGQRRCEKCHYRACRAKCHTLRAFMRPRFDLRMHSHNWRADQWNDQPVTDYIGQRKLLSVDDRSWAGVFLRGIGAGNRRLQICLYVGRVRQRFRRSARIVRRSTARPSEVRSLPHPRKMRASRPRHQAELPADALRTGGVVCSSNSHRRVMEQISKIQLTFLRDYVTFEGNSDSDRSHCSVYEIWSSCDIWRG